MQLRTLLIVIVLGALITFAALNWAAFVSPFKLSIVFATVEAPLGIVLLAIIGLLTLLFLIYIVFLQSSSLLESRRQARDLQGQREIAEQAESSRFNRLHSFLEAELQRLARQCDEGHMALTARLEELESRLRSTLEQSANSLAAYLAEIDDKLEKANSGSNANRSV